jgi:hypothetical protein
MVSPPDAVAAFPSAEAVVGAIGQIEVHGVASRISFEVVEDWPDRGFLYQVK